MKKKFLALLNKIFDGKPPANVDLDKLAGDLENEVGTVPTNESILEMVKNAVSEALSLVGKEEQEDAIDSAEGDDDDADDATDSDEDAGDQAKEEKPAPAKTANKAKAKPAENGVSKKEFEALQNEIKSLRRQVANKAGNKAKPAGNSANGDEKVDVTNHEGVSWEG